jgi:hypothetical protein
MVLKMAVMKMGKIDQILMPDEKIIKSQRRIQVGSGMFGMPSGDLFLTNNRLLFIHSKGWSLLSPAVGSSLLGKNLQIPLEDIQSVKKGFGSVKIKADKEYSFVVSAWKAGGWVDAIQQAINNFKPPPTSMQSEAETPLSPVAEEIRVSEKKEIIREKEVIVKVRCPYCQGLYDELLDVCPRCGAKR